MTPKSAFPTILLSGLTESATRRKDLAEMVVEH